MVDITRAIRSPVKRSRAMVRCISDAAEAPSPQTRRLTRRNSKSVASIDPVAPMAYIAMPKRRVGARPKRSATGPYTIWPAAMPRK